MHKEAMEGLNQSLLRPQGVIKAEAMALKARWTTKRAASTTKSQVLVVHKSLVLLFRAARRSWYKFPRDKVGGKTPKMSPEAGLLLSKNRKNPLHQK